MFTGLVQDIGTVQRLEKDGDWRIEIETALDLTGAPEGASVCCSGVCLTVIEKAGGSFTVQASGETVSLTTVKDWAVGRRINLEPSLKMGDELGGHFVFGHVDGEAVLHSVTEDGESYRLSLSVPEALSRYIAPKGSVCLNGVSLTVNALQGNVFEVNIIPHTWEKTNLQFLDVGERLNIEVDMLARYVERMMGKEGS